MGEQKASLGILFVHGIGEQPQGQTLWYFGEPLIRWLNSWLKRGSDSPLANPVAITKSIVNPAQRQLHDPAHAWLTVATPAEKTQAWLLAESWWGAELQRPAFRRVATWMLTTGTWMIISHAFWRTRSKKEKTAGLLVRWLVAAVLSVVIAGLTQLGVLALMVLALIPVERLRKALSGLLLALTGVLGDSYVFIENRIQRAAIVTKVREDLGWLAQQCESVVVIAHSQGAAVAHEALQATGPETQNVRLLVTVGSGLAKLKELESVAEIHRGRLLWTAISIPLTILAVLTAVRSQTHAADFPHWLIQLDLPGLISWVCGFMAFIFMGVTLMVVTDHSAGMQKQIGSLVLGGWRDGMEWFDVYASRDPVPNGPLADDGEIEGFTSQPITNGMSVLGDHTGYWENSAEIFPKIFRKMDSVLSPEIGLFHNGEDGRQLDAAAADHRRRVLLKVVAFWSQVLGGLLFLVRFWNPELVGLGSQRIWPALKNGALAFLGKPMESAAQAVKPILVWILGPKDFSSLAMGLLGATVPMVLTMIWYLGFSRVWAWRDGLAVQQLFAPQNITLRKGQIPLAILVSVAGFFPLALALWLIMRPKHELARLEEEALLALGMVIIAFFTFSAVVAIVGEVIDLVKDPPAGSLKNALHLLWLVSIPVMVTLSFLSSGNQALLERAQRIAGNAFAVAIGSVLAIVGHRKLLQKAAAAPGWRPLWWIALLLPPLLSLAAGGLVYGSVRNVLANVELPATDVILGFIGWYALGMFICWVVVKLATRGKPKSAN